MNRHHTLFIESIKDIYQFIAYNEDENTLVFHEIFNGVPDPDYLSYVVIDEGYVTIDWVVGPKQDYHDYTELGWAEEEFELQDWLLRKEINF